MTMSGIWIPVGERLPKEHEVVLVTIYPSYEKLCPWHAQKALEDLEEVGRGMAKRLYETPRVTIAIHYTEEKADGTVERRWAHPGKATPIQEGWIVSTWAPIPKPYDHTTGTAVKLWW